MQELLRHNDAFLNSIFLGATVREWLIVLAGWAILSLALLFLHRVLSNRVERRVNRGANRYDYLLAALLNQTRKYFLIAVGLFLAAFLAASASDAFGWVRRVVFLVFLVQLVVWGNSLISRYVERYRELNLATDPTAVTTMQAVGFVGRLLLWVTVLLLALDNFGVRVTALVTGLGIGGIAVALAVQNVLSDLLASLSIVIDKPFAVGDFIIVNEFLGTVEHVGLKTTSIRSLSGEQIIFSNNDLVKSRVRNYKRMAERRIVFKLNVVYGTEYRSVQAIPGIIREIIEAQKPLVRFDRAHFLAFGDSGLTFEAVYYVLSPDYNVYMDVQQAINLAIHARFEREKIAFALPTQTLYVEKLPEAFMSGLNEGDGRS